MQQLAFDLTSTKARMMATPKRQSLRHRHEGDPNTRYTASALGQCVVGTVREPIAAAGASKARHSTNDKRFCLPHSTLRRGKTSWLPSAAYGYALWMVLTHCGVLIWRGFSSTGDHQVTCVFSAQNDTPVDLPISTISVSNPKIAVLGSDEWPAPLKHLYTSDVALQQAVKALSILNFVEQLTEVENPHVVISGLQQNTISACDTSENESIAESLSQIADQSLQFSWQVRNISGENTYWRAAFDFNYDLVEEPTLPILAAYGLASLRNKTRAQLQRPRDAHLAWISLLHPLSAFTSGSSGCIDAGSAFEMYAKGLRHAMQLARDKFHDLEDRRAGLLYAREQLAKRLEPLQPSQPDPPLIRSGALFSRLWILQQPFPVSNSIDLQPKDASLVKQLLEILASLARPPRHQRHLMQVPKRIHHTDALFGVRDGQMDELGEALDRARAGIQAFNELRTTWDAHPPDKWHAAGDELVQRGSRDAAKYLSTQSIRQEARNKLGAALRELQQAAF